MTPPKLGGTGKAKKLRWSRDFLLSKLPKCFWEWPGKRLWHNCCWSMSSVGKVPSTKKPPTWGYICPLNSQPKKDFNTACPSCILYPKETQNSKKSRWIAKKIILSRPPWWAPGRSVLSQNSSATSTLRGKIPSRIRATTQVQIHKNTWFFWNITYIIHSWHMYDWILLCIMKRYQKSAESQNQQYSSAFTRQAKNTTEQRSWSQLFFVLHFFPQSMQIFGDASFFNLAQSMLLPETRHVAIREPQNHWWIPCQYRFHLSDEFIFRPSRWNHASHFES